MKHVGLECKELVRNMLLRHEGIRLKPYRCTAGKLTIGVGRNLEDKGISSAEAVQMLNNDIEGIVAVLTSKYQWFRELNEVRKAVIIDMAFNLGVAGFSAFRKTISFLAQHEYTKASQEMLDSKWALQVGKRANYLSTLLRNGHL